MKNLSQKQIDRLNKRSSEFYMGNPEIKEYSGLKEGELIIFECGGRYTYEIHGAIIDESNLNVACKRLKKKGLKFRTKNKKEQVIVSLKDTESCLEVLKMLDELDEYSLLDDEDFCHREQAWIDKQGDFYASDIIKNIKSLTGINVTKQVATDLNEVAIRYYDETAMPCGSLERLKTCTKELVEGGSGVIGAGDDFDKLCKFFGV